MRRSGLALAILAIAGGCETMSDGTFNDIGKSVLGGVMGTAAATASMEIVRETADSMCKDGDAMCRNLTMVAMTGFTQSFIDRLTETDVRKIDEARKISIESGETEEWSNPDTGASGRVTSVPAEPKPPQPTPVKVKKDRLESLPMMDAVGEPYTVSSSSGARVRGGPGTDYEVVDQLAGGEQVTAIGRVRDDDWFLVGRGPVGIGYVFTDLLEPWVAPADAPLEEALSQGGEAPEQEAADVAEVEVQMASECFTTTQTVTLSNGDTEEAQVTSCRTPDGWAQV